MARFLRRAICALPEDGFTTTAAIEKYGIIRVRSRAPTAPTSVTMPPSPNTVHLSILTAFRRLIGGSGFECRGRSGKLLILRLTPRKLRRLRLDTTRSWRSSWRTAL